MKKKAFLSLAVIILLSYLVVSCNIGGKEIYYPLSHYTLMTLDTPTKKVVYLDWGFPLVYAGSIKTNIEVKGNKTNEIVYVLVLNEKTGDKGWVSLSSVIKDPVSKISILKPTQIYKEPDEFSRSFFNLSSPVIGYLVEVKDGWGRVMLYRSSYRLFTGKTDWTTYEWVKLSDVSTNSVDADLLSILYTSFERYSKWKDNIVKATGSEAQKITNEIDKEITYLENVIKNFKSKGISLSAEDYANVIYSDIRKLIYPGEESSEGEVEGEGQEEEDHIHSDDLE